MTLPATNTGYVFDEEKTVTAGDSTYVTDHDTLAENTDWLKEAKVTGWKGNSSTGTGLAQAATGAHVFNIAKAELVPENEYVLLDFSAIPFPDDSDGCTMKFWKIHFMVLLQNTATPDTEEYMPGGTKEETWNTSPSQSGTSADYMGWMMFWADSGQDNFDTGNKRGKITWNDGSGTTISLYVWAENTDKDLMIYLEQDNSNPYDEYAIVAFAECGQNWE